MNAYWINHLSGWNAQLFRELKGRLKPRNFLVTIAASLLTQLAVLLILWAQIPGSETYSSPYCTGKGGYRWFDCVNSTGVALRSLMDSTPAAAANFVPVINWQLWWSDLFQTLSWMLPFIVLMAGVYMLIGDLAKEERRGTLNFIRLSPQTSQSVLLGKILGVPILVYLAVGLAIPLHLFSATAAEISGLEIISFYLITIATCAFFYTSSLLFAFLGGSQGWVGAVVIWVCYTFFFQIWQMQQSSSTSRYPAPNFYFQMPINDSILLTLGFWLVTLGAATVWIWQAVNRRFRNPNLTLVSKRQAYLGTIGFEFWLLGFVLRDKPTYSHLEDLLIAACCSFLWLMLLIAALSPHRQTLLDWARYRRQRRMQQGRSGQATARDLIWGEKSPPLLAIAINLGLGIAIFLPWVLTWDVPRQQFQALAVMGLGTVFTLVCAIIAQLALFAKTPRRGAIAATLIAAYIFLPPTLMGLLSMAPSFNTAIPWLFTAFAFTALEYVSSMAIVFSFLTQLSVFSLLALRLTQQLRKAGESESKALLAAARS